MSDWTLVLMVLGGWFLLSVITGLVVGRLIREGQADPLVLAGSGGGPAAVSARPVPIEGNSGGRHRVRGGRQFAG